MWKMYNNIAAMDRQVGAVLKQLEDDGLLDKTIIFFYGDHGGPLPRQKRLIYDSGLNTPLIVRWPDKRNAGTIDDQLVSFIDLAPTIVSLAGEKVPSVMQGRSFLNPTTPERDYIHAAADRFDEITDAIRAVRDKRFKFIRNYRPEQGYYLPVSYREQIPTMQELLRLKDEGKLTDAQAQWFRTSKPEIELFDCENDPHELNNLATDPKYADRVKEMSAEMDRWLKEIGDTPNQPERQYIEKLWSGAETQPKTKNPVVVAKGNKLQINCETEGASIGYKIIKAGKKPTQSWSVYTGPVKISSGEELITRAHRIGYVPSKDVKFKAP